MDEFTLAPLQVTIGHASYPFWLGWDCLDAIAGMLGAAAPDRFIVVSDDTVLKLHGEAFVNALRTFAPVTVLGGPHGESLKTGAVLLSHLERAVAEGATRRSAVVAFGGGVPGNLGGMLAALLFRGIRLFHVPTTMLSAMDAVVSAKQAINSARGKNHFGVYHPPEAVYVDAALMRTLPLRELRSGLGELAKNCLAVRPREVPRLMSHLQRGEWTARDAMEWFFSESLAVKTELLAEDPKEQHRAIVFEYGHTVGHAIELADWQQRGAAGLSHGECVVLGMLAAARIARAITGLSDEDVSAHEAVADALGIEPALPAGVSPDAVLALVAKDGKRGYLQLGPDQTAMVLLRSLGEMAGPPERPLLPVSLDQVARAIDGRRASLRRPVREPERERTVDCRVMPAFGPGNGRSSAPAAASCPVGVHTEWDPLEEVIVGRAAGARTPRAGADLLAIEYPGLVDHPDRVPSGAFPPDVLAQTDEELDRLVEALAGLGVTVRRPACRDLSARIATPDWQTDGYYDYCPRDGLLTLGRSIIETPMVFRARFLESLAYKDLLLEYFRAGALWFSAPKPRLADETFDARAPQGQRLRNLEPVFDAANVLRFGRDLLYLVSDSGNEAGADWLESLVGGHYRVHRCRNLYASTHVDSTIVPLRPGLVLLNPARVNDDNLPGFLRGWDTIWAPDLVETPYLEDRSHSSKWIGMNLLMVRPDLAIVDDRQPELIAAIEQRGVDVLPLRLTHARTLGGGFHCVTLDIRRRGALEDYS